MVQESEPPTGKDPEELKARATGLYAHTLRIGMTRARYRRLRSYVARKNYATSDRLTHQEIFEAALDEYLTKRDA